MKQLKSTVPKETYAKTILFTTVLSFVLIISWFSNMGYIRLIYGMVAVPLVIHIVLLFVLNLTTLKYYSHSRSLKLTNWAFNLSILAFHLILPDDNDPRHIVLFGKIILDNFPEVFNGLYQTALLILLVSFMLLFAQLAKIFEIKTNIRLDLISPENEMIEIPNRQDTPQ